MTWIKRFLLLAILLITGGSICAGEAGKGYWSDSSWTAHDRGFLWYGTPPAPPKTGKQPEKDVPKKPSEMSNKELGAELSRLLDVASKENTPEAVKEYLYMQQYAMDRASTFSDVLRRVVWTTPDLDYSLRARPSNANAIFTFDEERAKKVNAATSDISKTHGLVFFFRADCPYCHQLASVLLMYQRNYGVEVFPISVDGAVLPQFPNAKRDNGAAKNLNIKTVPALFLADKTNGKIQPIGYGPLSLEELVNRVYVLTQTKPGQEY